MVHWIMIKVHWIMIKDDRKSVLLNFHCCRELLRVAPSLPSSASAALSSWEWAKLFPARALACAGQPVRRVLRQGLHGRNGFVNKLLHQWWHPHKMLDWPQLIIFGWLEEYPTVVKDISKWLTMANQSGQHILINQMMGQASDCWSSHEPIQGKQTNKNCQP